MATTTNCFPLTFSTKLLPLLFIGSAAPQWNASRCVCVCPMSIAITIKLTLLCAPHEQLHRRHIRRRYVWNRKKKSSPIIALLLNIWPHIRVTLSFPFSNVGHSAQCARVPPSGPSNLCFVRKWKFESIVFLFSLTFLRISWSQSSSSTSPTTVRQCETTFGIGLRGVWQVKLPHYSDAGENARRRILSPV